MFKYYYYFLPNTSIRNTKKNAIAKCYPLITFYTYHLIGLIAIAQTCFCSFFPSPVKRFRLLLLFSYPNYRTKQQLLKYSNGAIVLYGDVPIVIAALLQEWELNEKGKHPWERQELPPSSDDGHSHLPTWRPQPLSFLHIETNWNTDMGLAFVVVVHGEREGEEQQPNAAPGRRKRSPGVAASCWLVGLELESLIHCETIFALS